MKATDANQCFVLCRIEAGVLMRKDSSTSFSTITTSLKDRRQRIRTLLLSFGLTLQQIIDVKIFFLQCNFGIQMVVVNSNWRQECLSIQQLNCHFSQKKRPNSAMSAQGTNARNPPPKDHFQVVAINLQWNLLQQKGENKRLSKAISV
ncbi:hypothetical protein CEXT_4411 [Caerostris extrusa]|uniref:Uncharacterized protein n=1 Tax=Caerostris extrusa TaxID=172846 RepID=A0AAV4QYT7_CAEEX|nr:hypothetical protein CEXT_4411 [Caerostris extrusa]